MTKVLVIHGSRLGGTRGIAERIGEVLRSQGPEAVVAAADHVAIAVGADGRERSEQRTLDEVAV